MKQSEIKHYLDRALSPEKIRDKTMLITTRNYILRTFYWFGHDEEWIETNVLPLLEEKSKELEKQWLTT